MTPSYSAAAAATVEPTSAAVTPNVPPPSPRVVRRELDRAERFMRERLRARPEFAQFDLVREPERVVLRIPSQALFEPDSASLRASGTTAGVGAGAGILDGVAQLLRRRARLVVQIAVYTDAIGDAGANLSFSQQRAQAIVTALQSPKLAPERLAAVGRGESAAVDSNDTPEGREHNRRVEIAFGLTLPAVPAPPATP